jgi:hypothetical protein
MPPVFDAFSLYHVVHQPFSTTWARFFPAVPAQQRDIYPYPRPLSEEFWHMYAEPLYDFLGWVSTLWALVRTLGSDFGQQQAPWLARSVTPWVRLDPEGKAVVTWLSPSLVGSLTMMAILDATQGRFPRFCKGCGRFFVSAAYQAEFCSPRCRERVQKRNLRARMKTARAFAGEGLSVPEIAERLDSTVEVVSGWLQTPKDKPATGHR